jgi:hypothetical protein
MKKTVQIVTIPIEDSNLFFHKPFLGTGKYAYYESVLKLKDIRIPQQLLVLSDDEIGLSDIDKIVKYPFGIGKTIEHGGNHGIEVECITCTMFYNPNNVTAGTKGRFSPDDVYQIIASYPQIEGTLPISKETVQAWIDSGTPGEGLVKREQNYKFPAVPGPFKEIKDNFYYGIDPQGNLLLEFSEVRTEKEILKDLRYAKTPELKDSFLQELHDIREKQSKPSIPTNEEIKEKAQEYTRSINLGYIDTDLKGLEDIRTETTDAFEIGYKQALKDLVISKPDEYA